MGSSLSSSRIVVCLGLGLGLGLGLTLSACGAVDPAPSGEPTSTSQGSTTAPPSGSVSGPADGTASTGPSPTTTTTAGDDEPTGSGIKLDVGSGMEGNDIQLTGRVLAPNGELPIAGALVYLTEQPPPGIPDGAYCDECEPLAPDEFFATTAPDGTFHLVASSSALDGDVFLVVRKGQFLRIEPITVQEGEQAVPEALTQLPGVHDPAAGRYIPQIAVYDTFPDAVYNVLAKFGLGQVSAAGVLIAGTEQFTLVDDGDQGAFLDDLAQMSQYHIIFVPCATTVFWPMAPAISDARLQNIRDYVAAGGKWYATDHSNEYIKEPFPDYLDLHSPAMPDIQPAYTVAGTVDDPALLAWLEALPPVPALATLPLIDLTNNYSGIEAVHDVLVPDDEGQLVNVGPHTWVSGPCTSCSDAIVERPMAITGQYGCGRMMYSTFETSSMPHVGLTAQELVLLYMILEIGICQDELVPPPQG